MERDAHATTSAEAEGEIKPFLLKAYALVEDPLTDAVISWAPSGEHFVVHNPEAFANDVLPKNFKHNNFSSFIRQLNTYGFRKVETDSWSFGHDSFKRGQQHLLANIQRKRGGNSGRARSSSGSGAGAAGGGGGGGGAGAGGVSHTTESDDELNDLALMPLLGSSALPTAPVAEAGAGGSGGGAVPTANQILSEIMRMSQQQAEMLAEVKALQRTLKETRESQHLTRATIGKVVGFLHTMHGGGGGAHAADGAAPQVYLRGPGVDSPDGAQPVAKRSRLQLTDETLADGPFAAELLPSPPLPPSASPWQPPGLQLHAADGAAGVPAAPLFTSGTLQLSRQISKQLSAAGEDLELIDIDSVLDLLSGIQQEIGDVQ